MARRLALPAKNRAARMNARYGKVDNVDRALIDRIVERELSLPGVEAVDPAWKAEVDQIQGVTAGRDLWDDHRSHLL